MAEQPVDHDDDANIKPGTQRVENGCRSDCLGCLIAFGITVLLILFVPRIAHQVIVADKYQKWESLGIDSYSMVVQVFAAPTGSEEFALVVLGGELVEVNDSTDEMELERYQEYTIDRMFDKAEDCFIWGLCGVEFDSEYGFPSKFTGGFIETGSTQIMDFQPLDFDSGN